MDIERRVFGTALKIERRADGEGDDAPQGAVITGHAAVFDQLSEDLGGFREKVAKGAFAETIKGDDVRALINHSADLVIGRSIAKTLRMSEDKTGLAVEIDLPDTSYARDLAISIERGDVSGMSFGFQTVNDEWNTVEGEEIRTLKEVRLFDVSPVTFPAYPQTDVAKRFLARLRAERGPSLELLEMRQRQREREAAV